MSESAKTQEALVSVVVPVYKTPEAFLRACIESLQAQSVTDSQIILVDDGSPDHCGDICEEYAKADPRILVLHQKNSGPSVARNLGLAHATGRYLTFSDADDMLVKNAWETAIAAMEQTQAQCVVFGWQTGSDGVWEDRPVAAKMECLGAKDAMAQIAGDNAACGGGYPWNKMWDAQALREQWQGQLPLFNEKLFAYEDKLWTLLALTGLEKVVMLPQSLYQYRFVETSLTNEAAAWYNRQFNAYVAYDEICDYLATVDKAAYRAGLEMYFRFCFVDLRNMWPWRKQDMDRWNRTKGCLHKICRRIRPGDLKGIKCNAAWIVCLLTCWF